MIRKALIQILVFMMSLNQFVYAAQTDYSLGTVILKMLFYIGMVILVLFMAMYGTRFIAKNTRRFISSKYMKVIDVLNLGTNLKIMMIEIKDNVYVIAVTSNSIEVIEKLSKEVINQMDDFQQHFSKYTMKYKHMNSIYKNIDRFLNSKDNINEEEEFDNEEDR